jgi:hypothetical protein
VYNNPSGLYFDLGEMVRTDEFGNEIGRYDSYYNISSHSFNIPFIYKVKNLKLGLNLNYLLSRYTMPGESFTTINNPMGYENGDYTATSHFFKVHAGFIYSFEGKFSVGAKVISGGKADVKSELPDGIAGDQTGMANYPWKAGIGFQYAINNIFNLLADYNYTSTSMQKGLKDRHDGHFGIEANVNKSWTVRGGFFTLLDYRKDENNLHWLEPPGEYDQYFITFGAGYTAKNFAANIAILSSEVSPGKIKNTYFNGGLTFNF